MYLFFDTETSNFRNKQIPLDHPDQGRVVQLAALLMDDNFTEIASFKTLIKPSGWRISPGAESVHKISQKQCEMYGIPVKLAIDMFGNMLSVADVAIAHNSPFDIDMVDTEAFLANSTMFKWKETFCTMRATTDLCKLESKVKGKYKWPKLIEAYQHLFKKSFDKAHDAMADVRACSEIFRWLKENDKIAA